MQMSPLNLYIIAADSPLNVQYMQGSTTFLTLMAGIISLYFQEAAQDVCSV